MQRWVLRLLHKQSPVNLKRYFVYISISVVFISAKMVQSSNDGIEIAHPPKGPQSVQLTIVDEIVKKRVRNTVEVRKAQERRKLENKILEPIVGKLEEELNVPLGEILQVNQQIVPNYKSRYTEFDPYFETKYWGGPSTSQIKDALQPVYDILWEDFNVTAINEKISLYRGGSNPMISSARRGEVLFHRIRLAVDGMYFQQYVYQFSHELTHLLTNYELSRNHQFGWLDEMFAELGSAYILMRFAQEPPYQPFGSLDWSRYYNAVYGSLNDSLFNTYGIDRSDKAVDWLDEEILNSLEQNCCYRELNWGVARELLPHFMIDHSLWAAVGQLSRWDTSRDKNLEEFFVSWNRQLISKRSGKEIHCSHAFSHPRKRS